MAAPVTLVDENNIRQTNENPLFVSLPLDVMTDGGTGPSRRLRVDVGQTGFFAGREFRTFKEFTGAMVLKAVVPIDVILTSLDVVILEGETRLETVFGGTEGGTYTALPIFGRNNMNSRPTPYYEPVVTLSSGGTHEGGTVLDVLLNRTVANENFAGSVGVSVGDERGILPGTYYFRLTVTGTTRGLIKASWEERP